MTPPLTKPKPGAMLDLLHPINEGLVGCWLFNEGSGSKVYDISGNNNHGTCIDNPLWGGSNRGGGLYLNGSSNLVTVEDCEKLRLYNLSMIGWFYFSPGSTRRIFIGRQEGTGSANSLVLYIRESTDEYRLYGTFGGSALHRDTDYVLPENEWVQVGFTYDHSYIRFYVNGIEIDSLTETRDITYTDGAQWLIGADRNVSSYDDHVAGTCDGIRFYDRAIKASEMYQLYNAPFAGIITPSVLRLYTQAVATGWTGTVNGVTNPSSICGVSVADIIKVNGVSST